MWKAMKQRALIVLNLMSPAITNRVEHALQKPKRLNERPLELAFVFKKMAEVYPRRVLDVGSGGTALPALLRGCGAVVVAADNVRDYWPAGMVNRHYHVVDDDITKTRIKERFDFITCISVLEHIERADDALAGLFSLLRDDGHLVLSFPYNEREYVRNVYELPGSTYGQDASFITQSFSRTELDRWVAQNRAVVVEQEYWQVFAGDHWTVGEQVLPPRRVGKDERHQLTLVHLRKAIAVA